MPVVSELIRIEDDGTISFGNYMLAAKSKLQDFEFQGDLYKVKTFGEITKLERNGMFVYESYRARQSIISRREILPYSFRLRARRMLRLPFS